MKEEQKNETEESKAEQEAMEKLLKSAGSIKTRETIDTQEICKEERMDKYLK